MFSSGHLQFIRCCRLPTRPHGTRLLSSSHSPLTQPSPSPSRSLQRTGPRRPPEKAPPRRFNRSNLRVDAISTPKEHLAVVPTSTVAIYRTLSDRLDKWAAHTHTKELFKLLNLSPHLINHLLPRFKTCARLELSKSARNPPPKAPPPSTKHESEPRTVFPNFWDLQLIKDQFESVQIKSDLEEALDKVITSRFLAWAATTNLPPSLPSTPSPTSELEFSTYDNISSYSPLSHLEGVRRIFDFRYPAEKFSLARLTPRKIIMHVGPTNSGKTHNALVALATARSGVYAGPLRLLAHEVWNRLNRGLIALPPLEPGGPPRSEPRACNMITGEEVRIVDEHANMSSATVEMISTNQYLDVAVVDEIQMISDPSRGDAWTDALLGLRAKEVHLCGEDTAVDIVKQIVMETNDELVINRYERLSPLALASESLRGSLKNVRKGDCVVVFSRTGIFQTKRLIEDLTGMKCAVAYGGLPPEVRSEQAQLFNDPTSGYDVMVASDAVGMGLNLKIKRVVFDSLHKYDGGHMAPLSTSQIKQIAGRAGRFGLHSDEGAGKVTTLHPKDMPLLRKAFATPLPSLTQAALSAPSETYLALASLLPPGTSFSTICKLIRRYALVRKPFIFADFKEDSLKIPLIDKHAQNLPISDALLMLRAPFNLRSPLVAAFAVNIVRNFSQKFEVTLPDLLKNTPCDKVLASVQAAQSSANTWLHDKTKWENMMRTLAKDLPNLEGLHKALTLYLWFTYRQPVAFFEQTKATEMKTEVESAIEWLLSVISPQMLKRPGQYKATKLRMSLQLNQPSPQSSRKGRKLKSPLPQASF